MPYNVVNVDGKPYIKVVMEDGETKVFSPEEISAMIIVKMKEIAEAFVGMKIDKAVLTVPGETSLQLWFEYIYLCNLYLISVMLIKDDALLTLLVMIVYF